MCTQFIFSEKRLFISFLLMFLLKIMIFILLTVFVDFIFSEKFFIVHFLAEINWISTLILFFFYNTYSIKVFVIDPFIIIYNFTWFILLLVNDVFSIEFFWFCISLFPLFVTDIVHINCVYFVVTKSWGSFISKLFLCQWRLRSLKICFSPRYRDTKSVELYTWKLR